MSDVVVTETLSQTVERQAREIERLKKNVIHWREARRSCIAAGDMMQAEIKRLREDYKELDALRHTACEQRDQYKAETKQQREFIKTWILDNKPADEIERLRGLLEEGITVPQQLKARALSPVAWRKDYERRIREVLDDGHDRPD
jgi:hypothetical protein